MRSALLGLVFILLTAACQKPQSLVSSQTVIESTAPGVNFRVEFPKFTAGSTPEVLASLNSLAAVLAQGSSPDVHDPQEESRQFISAHERFKEQFPDSSIVYEIDRRVLVIENTPKYVTFKRTEFANTGGAHPNSTTILKTVLLADGKALDWQTLIAPGSGPRWLAAIEKAIRQARNIPAGRRLKEAGLFDDQLKPPSNFGLTADGVRIQYNPYDIAPYVFGATDVLIPWAEVRPLLNPALAQFADR